MAAKDFLRVVAGRTKQIFGVQSSAGAGNAGDIPALDNSGLLSITMMPVGVGTVAQTMVTTDNLAAGALVNVYSNAGTLTARNADCTTAGKEANGFVLLGTTAPASATVYFGDINTAVSGLTVGTTYYLSTVGAVTSTPPSTSGNVIQIVGVALSATELAFAPDKGIVLA